MRLQAKNKTRFVVSVFFIKGAWGRYRHIAKPTPPSLVNPENITYKTEIQDHNQQCQMSNFTTSRIGHSIVLQIGYEKPRCCFEITLLEHIVCLRIHTHGLKRIHIFQYTNQTPTQVNGEADELTQWIYEINRADTKTSSNSISLNECVASPLFFIINKKMLQV